MVFSTSLNHVSVLRVAHSIDREIAILSLLSVVIDTVQEISQSCLMYKIKSSIIAVLLLFTWSCKIPNYSCGCRLQKLSHFNLWRSSWWDKRKDNYMSRERERERERERGRERETDRDRERDSERQTDRQTEEDGE